MGKSCKLKTVFFGTPDFAVESLKCLQESRHEILAVVTAPDKPAGRGKKIRFSPVKSFALENGIEVLQPTRLKDENFISQLRNYGADLFTVVAFRMLPEVVWNMPPLGTVNVHASLLPQFRGAAPISHAIMDGESETGVTTFKLQHAIDTGHILMQDKILINPDDNAGSLHDKLMVAGGQLLVKTLTGLANGDVQEHPQVLFTKDGPILKTAPKLNKENIRIDWTGHARQIHDFIRGLSPYPGAYTFLKAPGSEEEQKIIIYASEPLGNQSTGLPGSLAQIKKRLIVNTGKGQLEILKLKPEGKKLLKASDYLNGAQLTELHVLK